MYTTITETMFKDEFKSIRPENFSNEGLSVLFDFFTELEDSTSEPIELDVIAICCDFSEEPLSDVLENYGLDSLDELHDNTLVVAVFGDTVLYQTF